jgi:hypothetical protein
MLPLVLTLNMPTDLMHGSAVIAREAIACMQTDACSCSIVNAAAREAVTTIYCASNG